MIPSDTARVSCRTTVIRKVQYREYLTGVLSLQYLSTVNQPRVYPHARSPGRASSLRQEAFQSLGVRARCFRAASDARQNGRGPNDDPDQTNRSARTVGKEFWVSEDLGCYGCVVLCENLCGGRGFVTWLRVTRSTMA
jgi:hypothetical protein